MFLDYELLKAHIIKAQGGDKNAYAHFLETLDQHLKTRLRKFFSQTQAEDVSQEVLLAIHRSLHTFDQHKAIAPWLNAIIFYKTQDQLREIYKHKSIELQNASLHQELSFLPEDKIQLEAVLGTLKTVEKEVVYLLKIEEEGVSEIANKLSLSESNVKILCFRAIKKLREFLLKQEFHE